MFNNIAQQPCWTEALVMVFSLSLASDQLKASVRDAVHLAKLTGKPCVRAWRPQLVRVLCNWLWMSKSQSQSAQLAVLVFWPLPRYCLASARMQLRFRVRISSKGILTAAFKLFETTRSKIRKTERQIFSVEWLAMFRIQAPLIYLNQIQPNLPYQMVAKTITACKLTGQKKRFRMGHLHIMFLKEPGSSRCFDNKKHTWSKLVS